MPNKLALLGASALITFAGCATTEPTGGSPDPTELLASGVLTFEVNHTKDPSATLPRSGTFQVESRVQLDAREELRPVLDQVVRRLGDSIEDELVAKGYRRDPEDPDFLVYYYLIAGSEERMDLGVEAEQLVPAWLLDQAKEADVQGMALLIDVLEPREKRVVWRGACSGVIVVDAPQEEKEKRTRTAVRRLLDAFPEE